jgi:tRNA dimethylallyltransferase
MQPLLVVVGETAAGKSALAMSLAEQFDGELLCADSWTVYKGFNIGSAKPGADEQARIPHHMLDIADPVEGFSAAVFKRLAQQTIIDITARGKLPIMVGGTGLYIDSVLYDYGFLKPSDPARRAELNTLPLADLVVRAEAMQLDTSTIDLQNKRRVIRLIENNGQLPTKQALRQNTCIIGLHVPRDALVERVTLRVDSMLQQGLEYEVMDLSRRYGWDVEPMKGIGYREWREYFTGSQDVHETRLRIIKSTMDLAKRQRTWFKRNSSIQWVNDRSSAVEITTTFLNKTD